MKNSLKLITLLIFIGGSALSQQQSRQLSSGLFLMDSYIKKQAEGINFKDTDTYTGTPYNNASYLPGSIYKEGKLLAENIALRYNAIADEMEVKENFSSSDDDAKVLTKSPDIFVKIAGTIFVFVPYQGGIEEGGYFEVIYEGSQVDFYKKIIKDFDEAKKATSSLTRDIPASFSDEPEYFLVTKVGKFYQFPNSRNKKLKVFGDKEKAVKKYVKEKRLDLNDEKDLLKAIRYFETI